jgi:hypothetical protein
MTAPFDEACNLAAKPRAQLRLACFPARQE